MPMIVGKIFMISKVCVLIGVGLRLSIGPGSLGLKKGDA